MDKYHQYSVLEKEIQLLEEKKDILRQEIAKELPDDGVKNDFVNAYWTIRKSWTYSPRVEGLTTELKATKKLEEESGVAKAEEIKQLTIKVK